MESVPRPKTSLHPKNLLNDHSKTESKNNLDNNLLSEYKIDESEKKLLNFWNSKLEAMEKINLDDEYLVKGEIEIIKVNTGKNVFPKCENLRSREERKSQKKKTKKNNSRKKSKNKSNNKNMIIHHDGKIEKTKMESKDLANVINLDNDKEFKKKDLNQFFSNQTLLTSIINGMKE